VHDAAVIESAWLGCRYHIRPAVIYGCELGAIGARGMFVLKLNIGRLDVLFPRGPLFLGGFSRADTAIAAVIANAG
jgi:hypothetical protein